MLFLSIYLGPTLVVIFWGGLLRRMVRLKSSHRITSIADFISARYEKSEPLAALVTLILLSGSIPYVALQLKSVLSTFAVITAQPDKAGGWFSPNVGLILVAMMILFTIIFGVRRLEPTGRHEGMVMAVAAESLVKLVCALAAGLFVAYWMFDGVQDIYQRFESANLLEHKPQSVSLLSWIGYLILSGNAILCLPRQFHISVVENQSEAHIGKAMWLFPLYLFAINFFIMPIALAGLLKGYPLSQADTFVLRLPLDQGNPHLALMVFIGGFSAATGMIMICSMTMATMISNHVLLPLVDWVPRLEFIERRLLGCRWITVAAFILMGYWFDRLVGHFFRLADIGMLSFGAVMQLAPAVIGGLYWRGGNSKGAMTGLWAGFLVWAYTLLLPAFVKSGWFVPALLEYGPFNLGILRPQQLFGLAGLDPVTHTVFWSLLFNCGFYILGSLLAEPSQEGQSQAEAFMGSINGATMFHGSGQRKASIVLDEKKKIIMDLFSRYFGRGKAWSLTERSLAEVGLSGKKMTSIKELAELYVQVEKSLGGSIGSATANRALFKAGFFSAGEADELREMYAEILANLRASPEELKRKIDFYQEREALINRHARELEEKVDELEDQMAKRREAEERLGESEERYRIAIEGSNDGVVVIRDDHIIWGNRRLAEIFGYIGRQEVLGKPLAIIVDQEDRELVINASRKRGLEEAPMRFDFKGLKKDGTQIYIAVSGTTIQYRGDTMFMAYLRDVTRRRMAEEEVRNLSRRLIEGIEEERRRVAADLHDEFGQALTGLHMGVESLKDFKTSPNGELEYKCDKLVKTIERMAENLRKISSQLRPDMLDHLGLVPTVEWHLEEFLQRIVGLEVEFQAVGFNNRKLGPQVEIVLYRILQEALNNVAKHSGATRVQVKLTYSHPKVIMVISDNGKGFEQNRNPQVAGPAKRGIGLVSMKERVASASGSIDIRSTPGKGTTIRVILPAALPKAA